MQELMMKKLQLPSLEEMVTPDFVSLIGTIILLSELLICTF